ncbi:MAG TPA: hypothetical protein DEA55_05550, partial [Rhodospirillaceae bacterium]|nr:hypothetical protein [Rhodospirillaceae bacterium]
EHNLDYKNHLDQKDLNPDLVKQSLLAHYRATGTWLSCSIKAPDGKKGSYILEHGPYAGQTTAGALDAALSTGARSLPGGSSIAALNAELSREHNLDYKNFKNQDELDLDLIKQSLLVHRRATGTWLSCSTKAPDGKKSSYILEHGPYAGQISANNLNAALSTGTRGLPGGSSIAKLNAELSDEHNLDYKNVKDQVDLDLDLIKQSLLAHRLATGTWLSVGAKTPNGKRVNYFLEHGPYAGQMTAGALDACLAKGSRGLPGGSSIAKLNREIQAELAADPSADFPEPV